MSDDYEEADYEEEDFQEAPEVNTLSRYEEIVFCPSCDVYMPYKVDGAIVRRRCPQCAKEFEGGQEVTPGSAAGGGGRAHTKGTGAAATSPARPQKATPTSDETVTCAAITKAGTPCQNLPRAGSKYCSSHRGYRPPRK